MNDLTARDQWKTKIGLVLAMAGNAVGLGNFLRFPGKAAANGGGAFMIPYFITLILMAIPLMWLEWTQGRFGGMKGHGTTPGMFHSMWRNPIAKYLGVLGIFIPTMIVVYYAYIGSWTLGFGIYSLFNELPKVDPSVLHQGLSTQQISEAILQPFEEFRISYTGKTSGEFLQVQLFTYTIFIAVLSLSLWLLVRGVSKGIEVLAKIAMPMLFAIAVFLVIRVLTLGHPVSEAYGSMDGFSFLWEPKWFIEKDGRQVFVLLDPQGEEILAHGEVLPGDTTNNVAEYTALLRGLQAAAEHGVRCIRVRLDSELVVRQIRGEYRVRHAGLKPLYAAVMHEIPRFGRFHIEHVPRAENKRADALANAALDDLVSP